MWFPPKKSILIKKLLKKLLQHHESFTHIYYTYIHTLLLYLHSHTFIILTFTHLYLYLHLHTCIYTYIHTLLFILTFTHFYLYLHSHTFIYTYIHTLLFILTSTHFYLYLHSLLALLGKTHFSETWALVHLEQTKAHEQITKQKRSSEISSTCLNLKIQKTLNKCSLLNKYFKKLNGTQV